VGLAHLGIALPSFPWSSIASPLTPSMWQRRITAPSNNDVILSGQPFNIAWGAPSDCASSQFCTDGQVGYIQLSLSQYVRGYPGLNVCTNFTGILEVITTNAPNNGSLIWNVPGNLTSDHNYILSGYQFDPVNKYINGLQSGLFTIEKSLGQYIPGSNTTSSTASSSPTMATLSATSTGSATTATPSSAAFRRRRPFGIALLGVLAFCVKMLSLS